MCIHEIRKLLLKILMCLFKTNLLLPVMFVLFLMTLMITHKFPLLLERTFIHVPNTPLLTMCVMTLSPSFITFFYFLVIVLISCTMSQAIYFSATVERGHGIRNEGSSK